MSSIVCENLGLKATFYDQLLTRVDLKDLCFKHKILELIKFNINDTQESDCLKLLEKIGFNLTTANKIIKMSIFIPINQFTLFDWIEYYITMKFKILQPEFSADYPKIVWSKLVISLNLSSKIHYLNDANKIDPLFVHWYHGTTNLSANEIRNYGINVSCNYSYKNFGSGFYLTDDPKLALEYACFTTNYMRQLGVTANPSVLVFEIPLSNYECILRRYKVKNLSDKPTEWTDVINFYAFCHKEIPTILGKNSKDLRQIEIIIGPQAELKSEENINKIFSRKTKSLQMCIKKQQFADEFSYLSRIYYLR